MILIPGYVVDNTHQVLTLPNDGMCIDASEIRWYSPYLFMNQGCVVDKYLRCWLNDGNVVRVRRKGL